jgi:hypothetical protein
MTPFAKAFGVSTNPGQSQIPVDESDAVVGLAGRQEAHDWKTLSVGPGMDFGREATAQAAKSLILNPPRALCPRDLESILG